nr:MAG TPA: hypothetical protein [Caudoviricetes sp.]
MIIGTRYSLRLACSLRSSGLPREVTTSSWRAL